jgi:hypothetical protein
MALEEIKSQNNDGSFRNDNERPLTMVLEEEMIIHLKVLEDKTQNNQEITVLETMRLEKMKK